MSKPVSRGEAVGRTVPPSPTDDGAQRAVVHVDHPPPGDPSRVDAEPLPQ